MIAPHLRYKDDSDTGISGTPKQVGMAPSPFGGFAFLLLSPAPIASGSLLIKPATSIFYSITKTTITLQPDAVNQTFFASISKCRFKLDMLYYLFKLTS